MEINTGAIKNNAETYLEYIDNMKKESANIKSAIENLKSGWKSNASDGRANDFYKAIEEVYVPELDTAIAALRQYYDYISKVPGAYQTFDDSYASKNIEV